MRILTHHLTRGEASFQTVSDEAACVVVYGEDGNCSFEVRGRASGVWIPLRGSLRVRSMNLVESVHAKELLVTEYDDRVKPVAHANGLWLAVLGGRLAWGQLLADTSWPDPQPLPDHCKADPGFRRLGIALARSAPGFDQEGILRDAADAIFAMQAPLRRMVARCPGRTYAEKRRVFLRLQRVHQFIRTRCDMELDNAALAGMANYSPTHFIRTFDEVFLETPHAYLVRQRLDRAERLLQSGDLAVREVALACGFENRSAFSRLYRQRFGMTAHEATRHSRSVVEANSATTPPNFGNART